MAEEGEEANLLSGGAGGRKQSKRERFRDRLSKISDKLETDKPKTKDIEREEELNDFLKSPSEEDVLPRFPSPSRKPIPRIDVSSLPRRPHTHQVELKDEKGYRPALPKRRRRTGLTVVFAQTAPQIIGEGGDEAEAPTIRISQSKLSNVAHTLQEERPAPVHSTSANSAMNTAVEARDAASNVIGNEPRPRILVQAPTGLENGRTNPDALTPGQTSKDAGFELTQPAGNTAQSHLQPRQNLVPSSAVGLKRKMLEEEARAFTSGLRDTSPEPSLQKQDNTPPRQFLEDLPPSPTVSYAHHGRSSSYASDLLSPPEQSPSPSRPSSSSSRDSMTAQAAAQQSLELERGSNHRERQKSVSPRRKPLPKSAAPEAQEDPLTEFRSQARRYYGLFALSSENPQSDVNVSLSRWIRAATWWFLTAETNFKLLRKDLEEGATPLQITTSRRHMQAVVDLAKTAWIVEDMVHDYANAEAIDLSTRESIDRLVQADPLSRLSRTLQYWQDLSKRLASLAAAIRRSGFMTSTSENMPLSAGIDTTIWLTYSLLDLRVANWFRSANPAWVQMDDSVTPVEPFDLAKVFPLKSTANTFRMKSVFCHISGGFQNEHRSRNAPCILTIARRRGSYALVLFVSSQDHGINVVIETDPVRGDGIEWHKTQSTVLFNFADGFQFLIQLQQADYMHLQECYDLALRASTATARDALRTANSGEELIFRATCKTFERRSKDKLQSFPYEGEQRDCEILLLDKYEVLRSTSITHKSHRGFRLSVMLSPHAASLGILDVHIGGDRPILAHTSYEYSPHVELMDSHGALHIIQFFRNRDFERFYELLISLDHSASEDISVEQIPLRCFSVESSSKDATMFLTAATWHHVEVKVEKVRSHLPNSNRNMASSASISICVFSKEAILADHLSHGMYTSIVMVVVLLIHLTGRAQVLMGFNIDDPRSLFLWRAPQQDMSMTIRFRSAATNAPKIGGQLLAHSQTHSTRWKYSFATADHLHAFQKCLTGADVLFDGTASSFLVSRGSGLRSKKEELGATRLQIFHDGSRQIWQVLAYFGDGQGMSFVLEASDIFERSNGKGKYSIRLVEAKVSLPAEDEADERRGFLCIEDIAEGKERDDITLTFEDEDERDRLAQVLPASVKKASSLMGALHLR
jgi:hypothetical protein